MPQFAVRPDDVGIAAALTADDVAALEATAHLVVAAGREAQAGLGPEAVALTAAVQAYHHVEAVAGSTLAQAADVLHRGLVAASADYAAAESGLVGVLRGPP